MPKTGIGAAPGHRERVAERQQRAMNLRTAGASYARIAEMLGVSRQQIFRDVRTSLLEVLEQRDADARAYRALELLRCDEMTVALWPAVRRGEAEAVRAALRVSQRRCALLGLDAQVAAKLELSGVTGVVVQAAQSASDLAALTDEQLADRMTAALAVLRPRVAAMFPPAAPEPEPLPLDPVEQAKAEYARVFAARRAEGNGGGH